MVKKKSLSDVELRNYRFSVHLYNTNFYIDELVTEQQHSLRIPSGFLNMPSWYFSHARISLLSDCKCTKSTDCLK